MERREHIGAARNGPLCSTPDQLPWLLQTPRGLVPEAGWVGESKGPRRHPWKTGALFLPLLPPDGQARTQPWASSTGPLDSVISGTGVSSWLVGTHVEGAPLSATNTLSVTELLLTHRGPRHELLNNSMQTCDNHCRIKD